MAISNQTVLAKMMSELQEALVKKDKTAAVREHVRAVRLLCDLVLEEDSASASDQEMAKMMGDMATGRTAGKPEVKSVGKQAVDHEEANGNSIFDF
ncbi:YwdI family protein [Virgibacillus senegalensis]|uniref:YwdI family protein n=1 Tax=Virgibacillus senegalensis TaxID=1499679 RepID=UPI00069EC215|nr:YwdI family protein [Virgibacillus senegalensis]